MNATHSKQELLVGDSMGIVAVRNLIQRLSRATCPVVILGETGSGKELVARSIHQNSPRASGPFLALDCGALTPSLMESELFGHVRGAYTDAGTATKGLFEEANGGTLFLDEIAEIPIAYQMKLLRALQEKEIRPVGGTKSIKVDVRVLAATHRDLRDAIKKGTFRQDLYYRLNVVEVRIPPLRAHKGDIPALVEFFADKHCPSTEPGKVGRARPRFSRDAVARLLTHSWPGNARELENCVLRALALETEPELPETHRYRTCLEQEVVAGYVGGQGETLREVETLAILRAVGPANGDKVAASRQLGMGRSTLYRRLRNLNLAETSSASPEYNAV